ncbi:MAG: S-layer homology domain-containing protein, partial [Oscillospiraceae bacterium]|nr:S-layer homology domain-containing protein [Oscillospiraceae bacterium]
FSLLAADYNIRTVTLFTSEDLIAACSNPKYKALILTAPSRRSAEAQAADPLKVYTDEELAAIKAYNENGGTVILAGWSDHYENYPDVASITNMKAEEHMAATQNAVLEALGSTLRIGDDATYDDNFNGGQAYRLYFNSYNIDSFLVDGVEVDPENPHDRLYTEVYSHYGGASVYTVDGKLSDTVTPVVFGHSGTYSVDVDKDGLGGDSMNKYAYADGDNRLMVLASEQLDGKGLIIVSGAAFMSNFEVQATIEDSGSEKNYSNYKICENLLAYLNPVSTTPIAEVQAQTEAGYKYTIEGIVTSNASGYDKDTAFFDCIYVQDETGGICCFPVAGNFKIGDKVRVTGTTEFYQGEMELQVSDIQLIGSGSVEAKNVKAAQVNDGSVIGQLITVKGSVVSYEEANGLVQTIMVKDGYGTVVRVFIDGYITTDKDVQNLAVGNLITVTGLASYDNTFNAPEGPFPRIRIRDRADIVCTRLVAPPDEPVPERFPFTDVESDDWFYGDVFKIWKADIMNGVSETLFAPQTTLNRAMFATMIYRLSGEEYEGEGSAFEDVEEGKWYSDAIAWCAEKGVVTGFSETVFGPESPVTREQAAAMLYRYAEYKGYDVSAGEKTDLSDFTDADNVSSYAENAVKWAVGAGIIRGMTEDTIVPTDSSTRAQIACMFNRFIAWCE